MHDAAMHEARMRRQAFLAVLLAAFCIGFSPILVRFGDAGSAAIGFWRLFFALGPTAVWAYAEHRASRQLFQRMTGGTLPVPPVITRRQFVLACLAGLFFGSDLITFHTGIANTTTANAILLGNLSVVFVVVIGWLCLGEKPTRGLIVALVLAMIGTGIIIVSSAGGQDSSSRVSVFGDLMCVIAALFYTGYMLVTRIVRRPVAGGMLPLGGGMASFIAAGSGAVLCLVWALATGEVIIPQSMQGLLAVIALGLISHATGQGLATFALGRLPAGLISVVLLLQIVVGSILAAILFSEIPSWMVILGGILVVAGVVTARPGRSAKA